jgi:hypothetical protein
MTFYRFRNNKVPQIVFVQWRYVFHTHIKSSSEKSCKLGISTSFKFIRRLSLGRRENSLCDILCSLESARETELGVDAIGTVSRVDVLDHGDLVASSRTLAGDDGRVSEEVFPDL